MSHTDEAIDWIEEEMFTYSAADHLSHMPHIIELNTLIIIKLI